MCVHIVKENLKWLIMRHFLGVESNLASFTV